MLWGQRATVDMLWNAVLLLVALRKVPQRNTATSNHDERQYANMTLLKSITNWQPSWKRTVATSERDAQQEAKRKNMLDDITNSYISVQYHTRAPCIAPKIRNRSACDASRSILVKPTERLCEFVRT